jgi:HNH endonuclease
MSLIKPIHCGPYRGQVVQSLLKTCVTCGRVRIKYPHISWRNYLSRKYCSAKCMGAWIVGQNSNQWKARRVKPCLQCGKALDFPVNLSPANRNKKFCSLECRNKYHHPVPCTDYRTSFKDRNGNKIQEHVLKVEQILGRPMRRGEVVHHVNLKRRDNRNCNLLVCTSSYHQWLHQEMMRRYAREHFGHL